jgi:hypothetical protein
MRRLTLLTALAWATFLGHGAADVAQPRCWGAASMHGCRNAALDREVFPTPQQALGMPNAPCRVLRKEYPLPCYFGAAPEDATRFVLMLGDSHAVHWRAAVEPIARARSWHGTSLTRAGCPYSAARPLLGPEHLGSCLTWRRTIVPWLREGPEIDTVVASHHPPRVAGGPEAAVQGYLRGWRGLPGTVKRIVVIRQTPGNNPRVRACVGAAIRDGRPAGRVCAVPRSRALRLDPGAAAARRYRNDRAVLVDMTRSFCSPTTCFPVIGGVLVHKDNSHITATYGATIAPYLSAKLRRLGL